MVREVYIVGDIAITMTEEEYYSTFSKEQIEELEAGETIEWFDEDGIDHLVRLI